MFPCIKEAPQNKQKPHILTHEAKPKEVNKAKVLIEL